MDIDLTRSTQIELEELYSKYQVHSCLADEFIKAGLDIYLIEKEVPVKFGIDLLVQAALHKRMDIPTAVGLLWRHFEDFPEPFQLCADMILFAAKHDLVDWENQSKKIIVRLEVSQDVQDKIDRFQYPLPMVEEPMVVKNNRQTGYRTIQGSLILKNNHHDDDICLDHINRVNSIPLSINQDVVAFVQNSWKGLDKQKPDESWDEYQARKKAFAKYDETSRDVLSALLAQGDRIWLTHKYDKRGRTYSQGYHVTYQGADWNKACIEFADAEPLLEE